MSTHRQPDPRTSSETERHLLSPSVTSSIIDGQTTPRAQSPTRTTTNHSYRGFDSKEEYLTALKEWAESKQYIQPDTTLEGYYGTTTMETYASRPRHEFGISRRWRERKEKKDAKQAGRSTLSLKKAS